MKRTHWVAGIVALGLCILAGCSTDPAGHSDKAFHEISYDQALARARPASKLVMLDFYADWCGPCRMLDDITWKDAKVQDWLKANTVAIKVDVDSNSQLAAKYNVSSIPVLLFLKPDGTEAGRLIGYHPPEDFLKKAGEITGGKKPE